MLNDSMERLLAHAVCLYHAVQVSAGGLAHASAGRDMSAEVAWCRLQRTNSGTVSWLYTRNASQSFTRDCQSEDTPSMEAVPAAAGSGEHGQVGKMLIMVWPQRHAMPAVVPEGQAPLRVHASPWALEPPSRTLLQCL